MSKKNLIQHSFQLSRVEKESQYQTKGIVLWLTGLSGSGKSTIANELEVLFFKNTKVTKILDGDSVRAGLCQDLSFNQDDRKENLRRIAEVSKLFSENGCITICCFISPLESQRNMISEIIGDDLKLIFIDTDLATCEGRDPKGLYKKARTGEIPNFTGIESAFEIPKEPDFRVQTKNKSPQECATEIYDYYLSTIK